METVPGKHAPPKPVHESRWTWGLSAAVLAPAWAGFLSWVTSLNETEIVRRLGDDSEQGRIQMLRMMGVTEEPLVHLIDHGLLEPSLYSSC